jgi:6-pyruvoyltetrahydropterin/6-carboxytetrahydropterin synthase
MFILTVEDYFASAHQLRGYKGKCENLHGHNWRVILSVKGEVLNEIGLLIDFTDLKNILKSILSDLDHKNLNEIEPFTTINPSSENIAEYISVKVQEKINRINSEIYVESVTIWESHTSRCTFYT